MADRGELFVAFLALFYVTARLIVSVLPPDVGTPLVSFLVVLAVPLLLWLLRARRNGDPVGVVLVDRDEQSFDVADRVAPRGPGPDDDPTRPTPRRTGRPRRQRASGSSTAVGRRIPRQTGAGSRRSTRNPTDGGARKPYPA